MSDFDVSRRRVLSAGALAAAVTTTSGCLELLGDENGSDRVLALALSREEGSLRDQYVVDLAETRIEWDEAAFQATLSGETYTTQYRKPFFASPEDPVYTRHDGTYYRLGSVVVDEAVENRPVLRLVELGGTDEQAVEGAPAEELPEVDQRAVRVAYMAARARGNSGGVPWDLVERGGYVYRRQDAIDASRLLATSGPDRVTFRERLYGVEVTTERFHEPVYRATAEPVAESPGRMEAILRAQFVDARFSRDDLSSDERDVLREAWGDDYRESHPYSEPFASVVRALDERAYLDGDIKSDALPDDHGVGTVRYDGDYYDYRLSFATSGSV